jgi:hypothetical protein
MFTKLASEEVFINKIPIKQYRLKIPIDFTYDVLYDILVFLLPFMFSGVFVVNKIFF